MSNGSINPWPTLTRDQWVAVLSVSQDADVDPDLWERPGEYFGAKVMMYLEASLRETLNLGEDFETRISLLSETLGDAFHRGVVLYTGTEVLPFGPKMWAVPVSGLWESIDG
ncbi:MAG: hypothetical protein WCK63_18075 [Betaproteobacteria bacterium]